MVAQWLTCGRVVGVAPAAVGAVLAGARSFVAVAKWVGAAVAGA